ncbi:uncharacterized protein C3orf20 homolog isoform X3 [Heliangelus exortis]|uniref:uncharacterized protein C3orf20 homolog isoform X3 n=1 Tax=Heliangelus exortis TaxID=472823 RepID=UPI003A8E02E9
MEVMFTSAALKAGPVYFFDQLKPRMKETVKKIPEEESSYFTTNHPPGFTPSPAVDRSAVCTGKHAESCEDFFLNDTTSSWHESVIDNMLQELGEKLQLLPRYETGFPEGLMNVLTCSWRELTEGVDELKWHMQSVACRRVTSRKKQASGEVKSGRPGSRHTEHEMTAIRKRRSKKSFRLQSCSTKGKRKPETASDMLVGGKVPIVQSDADQSCGTISFSLSSSIGEEGDWIFQLSDSHSEDIHQELSSMWTLERLEQMQNQIRKEQTSKLKEVGLDKPIILRHYGDHRDETLSKTWRAQSDMTIGPELACDKPQIPVVKKTGTTQGKLHYRLNDGSSFIYYPSQHLAVCQSYCSLPCGGFYTNIFSPSPDHSIVGTFTPFGHGSIYLPSSNTVTVMFNQEGGLVTNKDEEMVREWKWPRDGKLAQPVIAQVNEYITLRIAGRFAISLVYKWQHESVCLSLSPPQGAALPRLEEWPKLTELLMKNEVPEATVSRINDTHAARDLRNLQRKIRSIVGDWLQYYRTALGIDRVRLQKTSDLPLQPLRKCIIQSPDALPVTLVLQRSQRKRKENSQAPKSETPLLDQIQSAPLYSMQKKPYSYLLRTSVSLNKNTKSEMLHSAQFNLDKRRNVLNVIKSRDNPRVISQLACPAVLRRIMMGEEGKTCRCSNHQIPYVSDLEYDCLINNQMSSKEQVIVVCVSSSRKSLDPSEDKIGQLYESQNKNRSMPCAQGCQDSFRLLKYNITSADALTDRKGSLLKRRHNVAPGMFLMYIQGKLVFANYIFNGYSKSTEDLQKQIAKTRSDYRMGYHLPRDFKFSQR